MLVFRLDEGDIGGIEEEGFVAEQEYQQEHFEEQGKLSLKLALSHALHIKEQIKCESKRLFSKEKPFLLSA